MYINIYIYMYNFLSIYSRNVHFRPFSVGTSLSCEVGFHSGVAQEWHGAPSQPKRWALVVNREISFRIPMTDPW